MMSKIIKISVDNDTSIAVHRVKIKKVEKYIVTLETHKGSIPLGEGDSPSQALANARAFMKDSPVIHDILYHLYHYI